MPWYDIYNHIVFILFLLFLSFYCWVTSVANSLQNFSASSEENLAVRNKTRSPSNFPFFKEFGLKKNSTYFCLCEWENNNNSWKSLELERIRKGKQCVQSSAPFSSESAEVKPQICPAAPLFIRPFLLIRPNNRPVCYPQSND